MNSNIRISPFDIENTVISVNLPTALKNLLLYLVGNIKCNKAVLYIYNKKNKLLTSELVYINGVIIMGDEEIYINKINKDEKSSALLKEKITIKSSYIYIPLNYNNNKYGLLMVDKSLYNNKFTKNEIVFIKKVALMAAKGIYQNKILKDRDNKIKQLNALLDISLVLNTKNKTTILQTIGKALIKYGKFDQVRIYVKHRLDKYVCPVYEGIISEMLIEEKYYNIDTFSKKYITDIYYIMNLEKDENLPLGFIEVDNIISQEKFKQEQINFLKIMGTQLSITLKNISLIEKLKRISTTDALTNVYNYRYLESYLKKEIKRSKRFQDIFSILLCDIDDFKKINDQYGHLKGDEVLKKLIKYVKGISREIDVISRYGGDEFIIVAPKTDKENALKFSQKILKFLPVVQYYDKNEKIKISIGVSTYPEDGEDITTLIKAADKKLYLAKRNGKGRARA